MIRAILGSVEIDWREKQYSESFVQHGMAASVKRTETWYPLSGCAMLRPLFRECGYDPYRAESVPRHQYKYPLRMEGQNKIPYIKVGRSLKFRTTDLEKWLEKRAQQEEDFDILNDD